MSLLLDRVVVIVMSLPIIPNEKTPTLNHPPHEDCHRESQPGLRILFSPN